MLDIVFFPDLLEIGFHLRLKIESRWKTCGISDAVDLSFDAAIFHRLENWIKNLRLETDREAAFFAKFFDRCDSIEIDNIHRWDVPQLNVAVCHCQRIWRVLIDNQKGVFRSLGERRRGGCQFERWNGTSNQKNQREQEAAEGHHP